MTEKKYLVRPDDYAIFELDPSNKCYRNRDLANIKNRPNAMKHFAFTILTENYGFFTIEESEIPKYEALHNKWHQIWMKYQESDGHDGIKGRSNLTVEEIEFIKLEKD